MTNREKMKKLCATAGSYPEAARLIVKQTQGRPLSVDAIKSWTCTEGISRARPCPDWAVEALGNALKEIAKLP